MSIILLLGYRGLIGSATLNVLRQDPSHQIIVSGSPSDTYQNLPKNVDFVSSNEVFDGALKDKEIDVVVNCANSYENTSFGVNSPLTVNYLLPITVLESVLFKATHFINLDTSLNKNGSYYQARPYYSLSKKHFTDYLMQISSEISVSNLVCENVYGEGSLNRSTLLSDLISMGLRGRVEDLRMTKGEQVRDFVYVGDVASAIQKVLDTRCEIFDESFVNFEVGSGNGIQLRELVKLVQIKLNLPPFPEGKEPYRKLEIMRSVADISKLRQINWSPSVDLSDGLDLIIDYAREFYSLA